MNWQKALLAGVVAGIALNISDFILHGIVMSKTYMKYPEVFTQDQANPFYFLVIALCIAISAAILFGKTRQSWADGFKGGATFGFFLGMVGFWPSFYHALVIKGFPYFLSWCQGGINLIGAMVGGAVLGAMYRRA